MLDECIVGLLLGHLGAWNNVVTPYQYADYIIIIIIRLSYQWRGPYMVYHGGIMGHAPRVYCGTFHGEIYFCTSLFSIFYVQNLGVVLLNHWTAKRMRI